MPINELTRGLVNIELTVSEGRKQVDCGLYYTRTILANHSQINPHINRGLYSPTRGVRAAYLSADPRPRVRVDMLVVGGRKTSCLYVLTRLRFRLLSGGSSSLMIILHLFPQTIMHYTLKHNRITVTI